MNLNRYGVFLPGHTGWISGSTGDAGMAAQCLRAYATIGVALTAAGSSFADVVRIIEYVTPEGLEAYAEAATVRRQILGEATPAVNTVPVAQLLQPGALIQIEVTAQGREEAGILYLPTITPTDQDGRLVAPGDVVAQTAQIFKTADALLRERGSDLSHVVMTVDFLTAAARRDYKRSGAVRMHHLGPVYPGAAGIMQPRLIHPQALVQYDIIATRETPVLIDPGWERYKTLSYSAGVRAGKLVFLSGQGALDPVTLDIQHVGDLAAQAEYVYGNLFKVLAVAGGHPGNILRSVEFIAPSAVADYHTLAAVRARLFGAHQPAITTVVCGSLLKREMEIEIVPFAVLD
jgi:enamine deaminase RidA (YjgF/YER057c/UK114 family)